MSSVSLINRVKYSYPLYRAYYKIGSTCIKLLKLFLKPDDKLIVFGSFGGRKFDDSPKAIYEAMLKDHRFDEYKLIWAFIKPEKFDLPRGSKVKIDTFLYYRTLLKARLWVTNSSMTRGLDFIGINTIILNSWHGTPIKCMGIDKNNSKLKVNRSDEVKEIRLAQSKYDIDIFSKAHNVSPKNFKVTGLPRNDELVNDNLPETISKIKEKLGLPLDKKIILYAPTFREFERDKDNNCVLSLPVNLCKWKSELGKNYILLIRAHYEISKVLEFTDNSFCKNVSDYNNLNELMLVSDVLISDYSSIFIDFSILGRPMLVFAYDYDTYSKKRGLYFDVRKELQDYTSTEDELIYNIQHLDYTNRSKIASDFSRKYVTERGNASVNALNVIIQAIKSNI